MSEPEVVAADATIGVFPWKRRRMPGRQITDHQASRCRLVPAPQCRTSAMLSLPPIASWLPESRPATASAASGAVARLPRSLRRPGARSRIRFRPTTERYNDWKWITSPYGSRPPIMEPVGPLARPLPGSSSKNPGQRCQRSSHPKRRREGIRDESPKQLWEWPVTG